MEDKEMMDLLLRFKKGEVKAEDLDQETAERYLAFLKKHIRSKLDRIKAINADTERINKETEIIAQETRKIEAETETIREENRKMAEEIQKFIDENAEDEDTNDIFDDEK
ncbi:MAG: hypothetical protein IKD74_06930 [Clostridia bacterium]|nr:hypothetical protein [Clostridia bacterium]